MAENDVGRGSGLKSKVPKRDIAETDWYEEIIAVTEATHVSRHRLRLRFSDGREKTVDFTRWLHGDVFAPLRDVRLFKKFFVAGGTVCWPNGADVAPETLYEAEDAAANAA